MSMTTMALIAWIGGSLVAILFAFVTPGQGWVAFDRLVQTLSAVGTVCAVLVALFNSNREQRAREKADMERAVLVAAALVPSLKRVKTELAHVIALIDFLEQPDVGSDINFIKDEQNSAYFDSKKLVFSSDFDIGIETVRDLTHLPNNAAQRLMMGIAYIGGLRATTFNDDRLAVWNRSLPITRHRIISSASDRLGKASEYLSLAIAEMEKAVSDAGIEPTPEEIYGDNS